MAFWPSIPVSAAYADDGFGNAVWIAAAWFPAAHYYLMGD
jgi:hypothetical protein